MARERTYHGAGLRRGAMDEAAAVLKASDDEARRICQEIRRIGGADRGLEHMERRDFCTRGEVFDQKGQSFKIKKLKMDDMDDHVVFALGWC